jgi:lipid-A-disaccharide synthase
MHSKKILIIAGETSGDLHGARLVERLWEACPDLTVYGIGGDEMERAGVRLVYHASDLAVVGLVEVMGRLRTIVRAFRAIQRSLAEERPDLVVLIDFPDFNLRMARQAALRGIPVVYYISPQVWAWRRSRIQQIAKRVTHMIVIFPFEEAMYREHGIPVTYVGHPLMDRFEPAPAEDHDGEAYRRYGLSPLYPVLGLFPGSRAGEVRALLPVMLRGAALLHRRYPRMQFLLGQGPGLSNDVYEEILGKTELPLVCTREGIGPGIRVCDLALVASGTATLEMALLGIPMIVVYRVSRFTFFLGRLLVRVPVIGMVNLVSQKAVVPELIQGELTDQNLYDACISFFEQANYYGQVKKELARVQDLLGEPGASKRAARVVCEILNSRDRISKDERRKTKGERNGSSMEGAT